MLIMRKRSWAGEVLPNLCIQGGRLVHTFCLCKTVEEYVVTQQEIREVRLEGVVWREYEEHIPFPITSKNVFALGISGLPSLTSEAMDSCTQHSTSILILL